MIRIRIQSRIESAIIPIEASSTLATTAEYGDKLLPFISGDYRPSHQCGRGLTCSKTVLRNTNRIGHSVIIINYKWNKRDVQNYRLFTPILKNQTMPTASLYTVPLSDINSLSRLTTTSNGQEWPIRKLANWPIRIWIDSRSFAGP